jgi:hypothetical protein
MFMFLSGYTLFLLLFIAMLILYDLHITLQRIDNSKKLLAEKKMEDCFRVDIDGFIWPTQEISKILFGN